MPTASMPSEIRLCIHARRGMTGSPHTAKQQEIARQQQTTKQQHVIAHHHVQNMFRNSRQPFPCTLLPCRSSRAVSDNAVAARSPMRRHALAKAAVRRDFALITSGEKSSRQRLSPRRTARFAMATTLSRNVCPKRRVAAPNREESNAKRFPGHHVARKDAQELIPPR